MTTAPSSSTSAPMDDESNPNTESGINLHLPVTRLTRGTLVISIKFVPAATPSSTSANAGVHMVPAIGAFSGFGFSPSEAIPATKGPSSSTATVEADMVPATGAVADVENGINLHLPVTRAISDTRALHSKQVS